MKQKLIEVLERFGDPVTLQGSLNPGEEYPPAFWTFWVYDAPESSHYDNAPASCIWGFWIYYYSVNPEEVQHVPLEAKRKLKEAGFIVPGKPVDAASDHKTHTGAMLTVQFLERYKEEV
ncbi:MAG: hypothetical protein RR842_10385 [Gordonibacter sp.]|uniref:hypothetical protein n=1 Tax=Gordonibacter sp. TaxID=1968902 RepID=UPI002FC658FB